MNVTWAYPMQRPESWNVGIFISLDLTLSLVITTLLTQVILPFP